MFLEDTIDTHNRKGWIEVIAGSMFSGKTEELIRRLKRAKIAKQKVEIFKPETDNRYHQQNIVSHDQNYIVSTAVARAQDILPLAKDMAVVGIDEAQFFDDGLPAVCNELANQGVRVIIAGLDIDYLANPFGPMPALLATAEYVTKVHAICMDCGNLAYVSHRKTKNDQIILVGEKNDYEPLCRNCYQKKLAANNSQS